MQSFLNEIAKTIVESKRELDQIKIIVPSIRAVKFLKEALKKEIKTAALAPEILSIERFISKLSGIQKISDIDLLFEFYNVYKANTPLEEQNSLYQFLNWAPSLLVEFNEIDSQLVDAKTIFSFMGAVEKIEQWDPIKQGDLSKQFFKFQERIPRYYAELYRVLVNQQAGYSGLQYREATQNLGHYLQSSLSQHFFVGLNALTKAEETIIQELVAEGKAEVYWDLDEYFFKDNTHSAGYFIRKYSKEWTILGQNFTLNFSNYFLKSKQIDIINVSKNLSQARAAVQLAVETYKAHLNDSVVLVLGDEGILHTVLAAIASEEVPWNATMGYPLKELGGVKSILNLFELFKLNDKGIYPLSTVSVLTEDQAIVGLLEASGISLKKLVKKLQLQHSTHFNAQSILSQSNVASLIFKPLKSQISGVDRLLKLYQRIKSFQIEHKFSSLDIHCSDHCIELLKKLQNLIESNKALKNLQDIEQVFVKLIDKETLDFSGDPFNGIQIMGVLETRVLDFDHVVVTHVNEGILPFGKTPFSWIPFDVRKKFEMNTFIEQDHLYAYHFFRLLQRAKSISLFYNDTAEGLFSGEKSRFLVLLEFFKHPNHQLTFRQLDFNIQTPTAPIKKAVKSPGVLDKLNEVAREGFSPSSLALYIRDPYQFYEQRLLKIKLDQEFESDINAAEKGTIIHQVLEELYKPYVGKVMVDINYKEMLKKLSQMVSSGFKKQYQKDTLKRGKNYLIVEVTNRILKGFIEKERAFVKSGNQLEIIGLEKEFHTPISIPGMEQTVYLKGTVDRIDSLNGTRRIVDYKTGSISSADLSYTNWEELITKPKKGALFQVMLYAYALRNEFLSVPLNSGIIPLKNFENHFLAVKKRDSSDKGHLQINSQILSDFERQLFSLIKEIFDPKFPFNKKP